MHGDLLNQDRQHQLPLPHLQQQQQQQEFSNENNNDSNQYLHNQHDSTPYQDGDFLQLDDSHLWTQDDAFGAPPGGDFDWTALGLDPFGTQLLPVSHTGSGTTSSSTTPDQDPLDLLIDPLPESELFFGDLIVPSLDDPSAMNMASGGNGHIFPDSLLNHLSPSMLDHHHHQSQSAFTPANASTEVAHRHPSPTFSSYSNSGHSSGNGNNAGSSSKTNSAGAGEQSEDSTVKRQRNTMAARRYRQRRLDRLAELEQKLAEMTADRDDLKVKLARREAEVGALREVLTARK